MPDDETENEPWIWPTKSSEPEKYAVPNYFRQERTGRPWLGLQQYAASAADVQEGRLVMGAGFTASQSGCAALFNIAPGEGQPGSSGHLAAMYRLGEPKPVVFFTLNADRARERYQEYCEGLETR
jgi:hypothetical protein